MRWHKRSRRKAVTVLKIDNLINANHMIINHTVEVLVSDVSASRQERKAEVEGKTKSKLKG
jgi:hypothetical protein